MLYIDKTMYVQELIESCKYVFLSRPHRFGKSLFISTLSEYFYGNKAMFEGLALYNFSKWEKHPVIRLDFSSLATTNADDLKTGLSVNEILIWTKLWYNGYSWDGKTKLYNPFAILSFFNLYRFRNFWFETGTPNYLMQLIKKGKYDLNTFDNLEISSSTSQLEDLHNLDLKCILFQTGYLTISQVILMFGMEKFVLDVPNYEVQNALYSLLFANLTEQPVGDVNTGSFDLIYYLNNEYIEGFTNTIKSLFARIPSNLFIEEEKYYHSLFIMMMYMSGITVESEINTNTGRIDGVIEFSDKIYIVELKHKKGAETGLKQITDKKYLERYLNSGKKIILVGASFSRENIDVKSEIYKK